MPEVQSGITQNGVGGVAMKIKITERGWPAHYCCASSCLFRRNTLIEYGKKKIVVSSVGSRLDEDEKSLLDIGINRYWETMAFKSKQEGIYTEANIQKQISFSSPWALGKAANDLMANDMHEKVVKEIAKKLKAGVL
jgi:hypothetical protein